MKNEWRAGHDNTYSIVLNSAIVDVRLSDRAFRVLAYLAGKPDSWNVFNADVCKKLGFSERTLHCVWGELVSLGWITRKKSTISNTLGLKVGTFQYTLVDPKDTQSLQVSEPAQVSESCGQSSKTLKERSNSNPTSVKEIHKSVISHFNAVAGTNYKSDSKATIGLINGRIAEGYTLDDFKTVIDKKVKDWGNDPKMSKFIRPSTLFNVGNFENYLNEISVTGTPTPRRDFAAEKKARHEKMIATYGYG